MKKVYAFAFAALMAVSGISLSSCSKKDKAAAEGEEAVEAEVGAVEGAEDEADEVEDEVELVVEEETEEVAEPACSAASFIDRINACTSGIELMHISEELEKYALSYTDEEMEAIVAASEAKAEEFLKE